MHRVISLTLASAALGCIHAAPKAAQLPEAFSVETTFFDKARIGMGCLGRKGDSTVFRIDVIVDSIASFPTGGFTVLVGEYPPARPGYINQGVTAELQQLGSTRIQGTSCWHDAGVVFRGSAGALAESIISIDPRDAALVRVFDSRGAVVTPEVRFDHRTESNRVAWRYAPPR